MCEDEFSLKGGYYLFCLNYNGKQKELNELCGPEALISGFVKVKVAYGAPQARLTTDLLKNQYRIFFHPHTGLCECEIKCLFGLLSDRILWLFGESACIKVGLDKSLLLW